jgi:rod shape-determining protein MreB and related proteins
MTYQNIVQGFFYKLHSLSAARSARQRPSKFKQMLQRAKERIQKLFSNDLVVDLGTSNTIIYVPNDGVILNEPSVIAIDNDTNRIVAVGQEAKSALGRQASRIRIVRPLKDGVIADFDATELMLSSFIKRALSRRKLSNPRVLICAPGEASQVERRALEDAAGRAGARYVDVVEEPLAAAIGAGFDIQSGRVFMLVDIGGGTTDIAILGYGGPVHLSTLPVGGNAMDEAIIHHMRHSHCLEIGELSAEAIKLGIGSAPSKDKNQDVEVRGRDLRTGLPAIVKVASNEVIDAIEPVVEKIIHAVASSLEELSPEVSAGLIESGMVLTGGASQLVGLADRISRLTGIAARYASSDVQSVAVLGAGKLFRDGSYTSIRELMVQHRKQKEHDKRRNNDLSVDQAA